MFTGVFINSVSQLTFEHDFAFAMLTNLIPAQGIGQTLEGISWEIA